MGVLLAACSAWGLSYPLARALMLAQAGDGPSWYLAATSLWLRFALSALVVAWLVRRSLGRPSGDELAQGLGIGLFTAGAMLLQIDALGHADAATVAFLSQGYVVWIPLVLALFARRWPEARAAGCALLALLGLGVIAGVDPARLGPGRGECEALLGSLLFTAQILWVERPRYAANRVGVVAVVAFAAAALALAPTLLLAPAGAASPLALYADPGHLLLLVVLGIACTGVSMLLMFRWQPAVGATAAGLIYATEPLWAAAFALVLPGLLAVALGVDLAREPLTAAVVLGGGLVLAANLFLHLPRRIPARSPT